MRFYCHITKKPNPVVEEVKHGLEVVSQKRLCVFVDGQLDTEDPHVIEKLKARPDLFWVGREDVNYRTLDYPQLVYEAERLGIKTYKVTKRDLLKALIHFERNRVSGKVEAVKVGERTKDSKSLGEIRAEARRRVEKAQEDAELLGTLESIDEIGVVVEKQSKEDEIAKIEAGLQLPPETR